MKIVRTSAFHPRFVQANVYVCTLLAGSFLYKLRVRIPIIFAICVLRTSILIIQSIEKKTVPRRSNILLFYLLTYKLTLIKEINLISEYSGSGENERFAIFENTLLLLLLSNIYGRQRLIAPKPDRRFERRPDSSSSPSNVLITSRTRLESSGGAINETSSRAAIRNQSKYIFLGRRLRGEEGRGRVREMQSRRTPRISRNELVIAEQRITFDDVHNNALCLSTNNDYADPVYLSIRAIEARGYLDKSNCCRSFETNRFDSIGGGRWQPIWD